MPKILEIGEIGLFWRNMPEETDAYYASYRSDLRQGRRYLRLGDLLRLRRAMRTGTYDLVVLHPPFYPGWHPRSFLAALKFTLFRGRFGEIYGALVSPIVFQLLRFVDWRPMVAIDRSDSFGIPRHHFFLLDRAARYYKREFPVDGWQVFYGSGHRRLPGYTFRMTGRWRRRLKNIRPIALGLMSSQVAAANAAFGAKKTSDVFFAGAVEGNSTVRADIPAALERLAGIGLKIDAPVERLAFEEFVLRCAQSWITLSPEGLGWDCYRHIEAALAGSVPLVNSPTIRRFRPLIIGRHCLAYYPDEDRLVETVIEALQDKQRLRQMAQDAHDHANRYLTEMALCREILNDMGIATGPGARAPSIPETPLGPAASHR